MQHYSPYYSIDGTYNFHSHRRLIHRIVLLYSNTPLSLTMQSSSTTTKQYHFGQALINEIIEFGTSHFAGLPCSVVFVVIVFMLDTTLRSSTAKLYFVCGYIIEFLLFYAFSVICFPRTSTSDIRGSSSRSRSRSSNPFTRSYDDDDDEEVMWGQMGGGPKDDHNNLLGKVRFLARPFQLFTHASFFNFSAGYVLGYWGNLNILTETPNGMIVNAYYAAFVLFCYLYSVFYLQGATSWQSGLVSVVIGIIGGMLCSSMIAGRVKLEAEYDSQFVTSSPGEGTATNGASGTVDGATMCDSNSEDMVCKVFQAAG